MALRSLVLCISSRVFPTMVGFGREEEEEGNWQGERNDFSLEEFVEHAQREDLAFLPVLCREDDPDLLDHYLCRLLL